MSIATTSKAAYHDRMQWVVRQIDEHLDDAFDAKTLSGAAALSKHRFQ